MQKYLTVETKHTFHNIDGTQVIVDQWNEDSNTYVLVLDGYPEYEPPIIVDSLWVSGGGEYIGFRDTDGKKHEANFNNIISIRELK